MNKNIVNITYQNRLTKVNWKQTKGWHHSSELHIVGWGHLNPYDLCELSFTKGMLMEPAFMEAAWVIHLTLLFCCLPIKESSHKLQDCTKCSHSYYAILMALDGNLSLIAWAHIRWVLQHCILNAGYLIEALFLPIALRQWQQQVQITSLTQFIMSD